MPPAVVMLKKHTCPMMTPAPPGPPIPHASGGMVILGCFTVLIGKVPAARMGDSLFCNGPPPHPDTILKGSTSVFIGGQPAARMGDPTSMGGTLIAGNLKVLIGG